MSEKWQRVLAAFEEHGATRTKTSIAAGVGCSDPQLHSYRKRIKGFREKEAAIFSRHEAKQRADEQLREQEEALEQKRDASGVAHASASTIPPTLQRYLELLSEEYDRIKAARAVGIRDFAVVEKAMDEIPEFKAECERIHRELLIRTRDAMGVKGAAGDTAAGRAYLAAADPSWKGDGPGPEGADADLLAVLRGLRERLEPLVGGKVIALPPPPADELELEVGAFREPDA